LSGDVAAGRVILASVDSTNAEAFRRAPGLAGPLWILAGEQTAGRGRRARPWASPPGNFHGTLAMRVTEPPATVALRSFVAALALRDAFVALTAQPQAFTLKWPNDVLLNGGKVAGILLEASGATLAIGIGVNLIAAPPPEAVEPGALRPVSLKGETGLNVPPEAFLDALAPAYAARESAFRQGGFAALRADWLAHAARLGQRITARTGTDSREGIFDTVDGSGNLILRQGAATLAIPAAEVFF
jgi:BirA family biotin operon repressor/biotin-[acetyl-CoA-carboxylase] ligase